MSHGDRIRIRIKLEMSHGDNPILPGTKDNNVQTAFVNFGLLGYSNTYVPEILMKIFDNHTNIINSF